eukprot:CAMPEP_0113530386 /NCGR_PEP_ID=MMETSP0015_2-20120614/2910_1 /TAXON_ID=2838 /ORGANISM="Odontella" /LENGTH=485 /DNA_ID=CAMNT_0000429101 /DNA_START=321 /DNA_END=1778 /DNA_ORIENTATION=+ /assembly_acc=CAM_ASM_000160
MTRYLPLMFIGLASGFTTRARHTVVHRSDLKQRLIWRDRYHATLHASSTDDTNGEFCEIGVNAVEECNSITGTESQFSAATNLGKCICGAGSFALPHVFLEEGVLGGTLAITTCGVLAAYTIQSLSRSKAIASAELGAKPVTSYVELAESALGKNAANLVFTLTLCASIGVCSTYLVFIGQTLESLSCDASSGNIIRQLFPDTSEFAWEAGAAAVLYPLSLIRDYSVFAFTSALGVFAVVGGILVTLASGIFVDPGGGLGVAIESIENLRMWPESLADAFGGSFGTIAYLFCVNFLSFPIMNSMKDPKQFDGAVDWAVSGVWIVNIVFAILCLGFYGDATEDLVLANLDNGPYLSALKILLCVDLLFTFPIVFSSGRQILENALIGSERVESDEAVVPRAGIVAGAVSACFGLAQIGGFGAVANLVGGVAQGTLAFIMPPAIAVTLARRNEQELAGGEASQLLVGVFGAAVVSSVTYFTAVGMIQ